MTTPAFLVTGATGTQGGSTARELLKAGYRVHALVRDASKIPAKELESLGAVLFVGDYADVEAINKATVGVKGVFINPYPDFADADGEAKQTQRFIDAARTAGTVDTLVLSTVLHADKHKQWLTENPDYPLKNYYHSKSSAEDAVRGSGIRYWTILRPPWLLQNYIWPQSDFHFPQWHTHRVAKTGIHGLIAHLDGADVGRFAAAAFAHPEKFGGKALPLAVENLTIEHVLKEFGRVAGVPVDVQVVDPDELAKDTDPLASLRATLSRWQNAKESTATEEEISELKSYGVPLTTVAEFLEKNKAKILETLAVKQ